MPEPTRPEVLRRHQVVVVGAGQAGLSASWFLTRAGVDHVVLERDTVGHDWRDRRWQNFTLVTPNWQCRLPGFPYRGSDPDGFMGRDEVFRFVRDYAASFGAPVEEQVVVTSVQQGTDGGFLVTAQPAGGDTLLIETRAVIVAVGGYHRPKIPALGRRLPDDIVQLHSSEYRGTDCVGDGAVVVIGSGQSGAQIAEDLHREGREVHLFTGSAPRVARFYRGRDCVAWLEEMGTYDVPVEDTPGGISAREKTNHYVTGRDGGHDIDLRRFALEGMWLYGRMTGVRPDGSSAVITAAPDLAANLDHADAVSDSIKDGIDAYLVRRGIDAPVEPRYRPVWTPEQEPTDLDLRAAGVGTIVWATGFSTDYRWLRVPAFDGAGLPCHRRGVSPVPGLFFLGLPWLHTWGSGRFAGVARDAEFVVDEWVRQRQPRPLSLSVAS